MYVVQGYKIGISRQKNKNFNLIILKIEYHQRFFKYYTIYQFYFRMQIWSADAESIACRCFWLVNCLLIAALAQKMLRSSSADVILLVSNLECIAHGVMH